MASKKGQPAWELHIITSYYARGFSKTTAEAGEPTSNETPYDKKSSQITWSLKLTLCFSQQRMDKRKHV